MEGFAYFPAIVYRDERPDLAAETLPHAVNRINSVRQDHGSVCQSGLLQHDPDFRSVADYVLVSAVDILKDQGYAVDKYDFYVAALWAQEISGSLGTNVHVHRNSQISGWLFLETPEAGAYPIYYDTRMNKAMAELDMALSDDVTNATNAIHFNNIQPGTVLFSNSWMQHQLTGANGEQPTRCLHFIVSHKERICTMC